MLQLSRLGIRNLATDDLVYSKGLKTIKTTKLLVLHGQKGKNNIELQLKIDLSIRL